MYKLIFLYCLCSAIFAATFAGIYSEGYFRNSAFPGKCKIQDKIVKPGESIKHPAMQCAQFTCDNSIGLATIESCDPVTALPSPLDQLQCYDRKSPPNCVWGDFIDTTQQYPQCCKRYFTCTYVS